MRQQKSTRTTYGHAVPDACRKGRTCGTVRRSAVWLLSGLLLLMTLAGCGGETSPGGSADAAPPLVQKAAQLALAGKEAHDEAQRQAEEEAAAKKEQEEAAQRLEEAQAALQLSEDYRDSFVHGEKGADYQKYIVLHDTEGDGPAEGVIDGWDASGAGVASHFIVNKDGTIVQCVPLDKIAHHAGYGDTGHNEAFGVTDESRDDMVGTVSIGPDHADYGMNSYSVGIEMVHAGGGYPEAQLEALDALIAYIDAYYGFESTIIDHKAWRLGNSDTSPEFSNYLYNYQDHRTHD